MKYIKNNMHMPESYTAPVLSRFAAFFSVNRNLPTQYLSFLFEGRGHENLSYM